MPITQIIDPANNVLLPIDKAAEHFDEQGLVPAETIYALIKQQVDERNEYGGEHLSPSQITPRSTCRRELILKRFFDYAQDPFQLWKAMEGTLYHDAFAHSGKDRPGAERELSLPDNHLHASHPLIQIREGRPRIEVFPGVWMRGTVDLLMQSLGTIVDYKTTKYTAQDYWDRQSEEWKPQINIYAYIVELLRECGITHLWVWRLYRGAYDSTKAFRKIPIQKVERDDLWFELKPWVEETLALLQRANEIYQTGLIKGTDWKPALEQLVRTIGMEGENMFKGKDGSNKCTRYCPVKDLCFGIEGRMNF
jgi:hypothetical protein